MPRSTLAGMNRALRKLIPAIVCYVTEHGGYVTKTKLLKLLYLFDVEYYRTRRQTFTGFQWKFFHLGPWAKEYDEVIDGLVGQLVLVESSSSKPEFDTKFYRTSEKFDLGRLFTSCRDEAALKEVLDRWGDSTTGEILDYVYFRTEPMLCGVRNQPLDFSSVSQETPPTYKRPSSGKTPAEIETLRSKFREKIARLGSRQKNQFRFTPPRYDAEFLNALSKLDQAGR